MIGLLVLGASFLFLLPLLNIRRSSPPRTPTSAACCSPSRTYVLVALGLNIVVGYAGLLDLGYVGFYAVGAYTVGRAQLRARAPARGCVTVPIAVVVALVSGVILGAPTLRVRGDYLAIVTLGFGEIIRLTAINSDWLGGRAGISNIPRPPEHRDSFQIPHLDWSSGPPVVDLGTTTTFLKFGISDQIPYYWLALVVIADRAASPTS